MTHEPPHEVRDTEKLESMIAVLMAGDQLPAIVAFGTRAICGSHRIAAADEAARRWDNGDRVAASRPELEVIDLSDDVYREICEREELNYLDDLSDYNDQCAAVYRWAIETDRVDVAAALADQI